MERFEQQKQELDEKIKAIQDNLKSEECSQEHSKLRLMQLQDERRNYQPQIKTKPGLTVLDLTNNDIRLEVECALRVGQAIGFSQI